MLAKCWNWLARIFRRRPSEEAAALAAIHESPYIWQALAVGGGGAFSTPPLRRAEAIRYVLAEGAHELCTVDDSLKIIFYRYRRR